MSSIKKMHTKENCSAEIIINRMKGALRPGATVSSYAEKKTRQLLPMIFNIEPDNIKMNQHANYPSQRSFNSKCNSKTHRHARPIALLGLLADKDIEW